MGTLTIQVRRKARVRLSSAAVDDWCAMLEKRTDLTTVHIIIHPDADVSIDGDPVERGRPLIDVLTDDE